MGWLARWRCRRYRGSAASLLTIVTERQWWNRDEVLAVMLADWCSRHPGADVIRGPGFWQAQLRGPDDARHVITRESLARLLDVLEEIDP